jgi:hypothetical protein
MMVSIISLGVSFENMQGWIGIQEKIDANHMKAYITNDGHPYKY